MSCDRLWETTSAALPARRQRSKLVSAAQVKVELWEAASPMGDNTVNDCVCVRRGCDILLSTFLISLPLIPLIYLHLLLFSIYFTVAHPSSRFTQLYLWLPLFLSSLLLSFSFKVAAATPVWLYVQLPLSKHPVSELHESAAFTLHTYAESTTHSWAHSLCMTQRIKTVKSKYDTVVWLVQDIRATHLTLVQSCCLWPIKQKRFLFLMSCATFMAPVQVKQWFIFYSFI